MVKKLQQDDGDHKAGPSLRGGSVKDSAQQIWQAGLAAFTKAQAEGSKAFEALVKEGVTIQRKTQAAAEERLSEATTRMSTMATDISSKAAGQWDKLENIFEERVAKALNKLGVPSAKDISALIARIDELNRNVQQLSRQSGGGKAAPAKKGTGAAAPAKKAPASKTAGKAATKTARKPAARKSAAPKA